jgi:hypothetical protein
VHTELNKLKKTMLTDIYTLVSSLIDEPPTTNGEINEPMLRLGLDCAIIAYNGWKQIITTAAADKAYYAFKNLNTDLSDMRKSTEHKIALLQNMYSVKEPKTGS